MCAFKMNSNMKNYLINQGMINQIAGTNGTAGTASLNIYSGTQPATADTGTNGMLICTISNIGWSAATAGTANIAGTYSGTAGVDGTAAWARMTTVNANGTFCADGDVSTSGTSVFVINGSIISNGDVVKLQSANILIP
jgi:hypothetical protein